MASRAIGTAQKHLYLKDISHIRVNVPNLTAQMDILLKLEPIRQMLQTTAASINEAKRINATYINSIFRTSYV